MLYEAITKDADMLEEELVMEHARRMKAERVLRAIANSPTSLTAWDLRDMASEYLEAA